MIIRKTREQIEDENVLFGDAPEEGATTTEEMREFIREYRAGLETGLERAEMTLSACADEQSTYDVILLKKMIDVVVTEVEPLAKRYDIEFMVDVIGQKYEAALTQSADCASIYWIAAKLVYRKLDAEIKYIIIED